MMQGAAGEGNDGEIGLFLEGSGSVGSTGSFRRVRQPFEGSGSGNGKGSESKKRCDSVFCSCEICSEESKKFSHVWQVMRRHLVTRRNKRESFDYTTGTSLADTAGTSCFQGFCGLKGPTGFYEGSGDLVSKFCGKLTVSKSGVATFLKNHETCSPFAQFVKYSSVVTPLLSQITMDDSSWWLLDTWMVGPGCIYLRML